MPPPMLHVELADPDIPDIVQMYQRMNPPPAVPMGARNPKKSTYCTKNDDRVLAIINAAINHDMPRALHWPKPTFREK